MILMWRESARGPLEAAVAMVVVLTLLACSNAEPRPRCAQCGMYADSAPAWAAAATGPEGATLRFDSPKCLFRYAAAQGPERLRALRLTEYYTQAERPAAEATLKAGHRFLATDPRVMATHQGSIGWCFGGGWSLQLALAEPALDAAVVYYGRLVTDVAALRKIHAPVLGVFGERDRGIPKESVDAFAAAMTEAGRDLRVLRYDAEHAFANPSSARYDQASASAAWAEVRQFLRQHLQASAAPSPTTMRTFLLGLLKALA